MPRAINITLWYEALASELGIILETSDPELAKQKLYALRKQANDPDLESIAIKTSPTNPAKDIWLVKKGSKE